MWLRSTLKSMKNAYFELARTLGLGPIPCTTRSPAIAERTITTRMTLRTLFTSLESI
jgi:glycerate kinase